MALIHGSLMAASPSDVGVPEEEEEAYPRLLLFQGAIGLWGLTARRELSLLSNQHSRSPVGI